MKATITEADREAARRLLDPEVLNYYDGYDYQSPEWRDEDVETAARVIADARERPTPGGEERTADRLMPIPPYMNPMTPAEVRELLGATMHGELPRPTMQRVLATLAAWEPTVRAVQDEDAAARDVAAILDAEERQTP